MAIFEFVALLATLFFGFATARSVIKLTRAGQWEQMSAACLVVIFGCLTLVSFALAIGLATGMVVLSAMN